jgi:hypothetical protein
LEGPVVVGIEATGAMPWFLELLEELGMVCRVELTTTQNGEWPAIFRDSCPCFVARHPPLGSET